jgi:hypothetical protein
MIWSLPNFSNFWRKNCVFLDNQCYDPFVLQITAVIRLKIDKFFGDTNFKILTLAPALVHNLCETVLGRATHMHGKFVTVFISHFASHRLRVTRWVCEKIAQNVAQPNFCQNQCTTFTVGKSGPKIRATSVIKKTAKNTQSPNCRKFRSPWIPIRKRIDFLRFFKHLDTDRKQWHTYRHKQFNY